MEIPLSVYDIFIIAFVLAAVAVLQFFRGRKLNLILIEYTARKLEEILKPKDKEYQWIGIYVGYKARFETSYKSLKRIEAVITLLPRQSLFYFPIALLTSRFDRLYLFFRYNRIFDGEAHIIRKNYYRLGLKRVIKGINRMKVESIRVKGKTFHLVYNDARLMNKLVKMVEEISRPDMINHLAIVPANKSVFLAAKLSPKTFEEILSRIYRFARSLA